MIGAGTSDMERFFLQGFQYLSGKQAAPPAELPAVASGVGEPAYDSNEDVLEERDSDDSSDSSVGAAIVPEPPRPDSRPPALLPDELAAPREAHRFLVANADKPSSQLFWLSLQYCRQ